MIIFYSYAFIVYNLSIIIINNNNYRSFGSQVLARRTDETIIYFRYWQKKKSYLT